MSGPAANKVITRDVMPMVQVLRNFLLGRKSVTPLRFQQDIVPRDVPASNLPVGPSHKVCKNYYYTRDGRREVTFPDVVTDNCRVTGSQLKAIPQGTGKGEAVVQVDAGKALGRKIPGKVYNYSM